MWVLYLLLTIMIILIELYRKKDFFFDYLTIFNLYFIGYYLFPAIMYNANFIEYHGRYEKYIGSSFNGTFKAYILILVFYLSVIFGYLYLAEKIKITRKNAKTFISDSDKNIYYFVMICISLWIIGLISLYIYSKSFGGIINLILNSAQIRNGLIESEGNSSIEFVKRFIIALTYPSYILFVIYLKRKKLLGLFIISIFFSMLWFFVNAGRGAILQYILILFLIYTYIKQKRINLFKTLLILLTLFVGINYLRPLFSNLIYLRDGWDVFKNQFVISASSGRYSIEGIKDVIFTFSYYFEHKYVSLETAISAVDSGRHSINFFSEIFIALISIVPSSFLFFEKPDSIIFYNTSYITGVYEASIPPGGIALGYYSLNFIGVVIFAILFGFFGKKISNYFKFNLNLGSEAFYIISMFVWIDLFVAGDLRQSLQRYFIYFVLIITMIVIKKVRVGNNE